MKAHRQPIKRVLAEPLAAPRRAFDPSRRLYGFGIEATDPEVFAKSNDGKHEGENETGVARPAQLWRLRNGKVVLIIDIVKSLHDRRA